MVNFMIFQNLLPQNYVLGLCLCLRVKSILLNDTLNEISDKLLVSLHLLFIIKTKKKTIHD